jgi:hypothetical protein
MFLVVCQGFFAQDIFIYQFLELKECGGFVSADVTEVVRTGASDEQGTRILIFLDVYFVESGIVVVLHTESNGTHQVIMFEEFHIPDGMYFFSSSYDFVRAVVVDEF